MQQKKKITCIKNYFDYFFKATNFFEVQLIYNIVYFNYVLIYSKKKKTSKLSMTQTDNSQLT